MHKEGLLIIFYLSISTYIIHGLCNSPKESISWQLLIIMDHLSFYSIDYKLLTVVCGDFKLSILEPPSLTLIFYQTSHNLHIHHIIFRILARGFHDARKVSEQRMIDDISKTL